MVLKKKETKNKCISGEQILNGKITILMEFSYNNIHMDNIIRF